MIWWHFNWNIRGISLCLQTLLFVHLKLSRQSSMHFVAFVVLFFESMYLESINVEKNLDRESRGPDTSTDTTLSTFLNKKRYPLAKVFVMFDMFEVQFWAKMWCSEVFEVQSCCYGIRLILQHTVWCSRTVQFFVMFEVRFWAECSKFGPVFMWPDY